MSIKTATQPIKIPYQSSLWQRFIQYQPSKRLVRLVFCWWIIICICTATIMSNGFGVDDLSGTLVTIAQKGLIVCQFMILIGLALTILDFLCLASLSQPSQFNINRNYPNNTPVFREIDIHAVLSVCVLPHHENESCNSTFVNMWLRFAHVVRMMLQTFGLIRTLNLQFYDDYPDQLLPTGLSSSAKHHRTTNGMPISTTISLATKDTETSDNWVYIDIFYPVLAIKRGTGIFRQAYIKVWSPFGLFARKFTLVHQDASNKPLRVLADFSGLLSNELSAVFEKSMHTGIQALLKQGQGSDFLKLREYVVGDAIRQIDWKASSRMRKLMSKAYDDDNDQDVIFLLDCGEQMRHRELVDADEALRYSQGVNPLSSGAGLIDDMQPQQQLRHFDQVLNAVLLLAYIANKQGDAVGLMTFAGQELYLPARKGRGLIRNLLNSTADLNPTLDTSDYLLACQNLLKHLKKRSLIVLISNTRTEASNELEQALKLLSSNHQIVFANLTEHAVIDIVNTPLPPSNMDESLLWHSLIQHLNARQRLHRKLSQSSGAICLDATAKELPLKLIQTYMMLKAK